MKVALGMISWFFIYMLIAFPIMFAASQIDDDVVQSGVAIFGNALGLLLASFIVFPPKPPYDPVEDEERLREEYLKEKRTLKVAHTKEFHNGAVGAQISREIKSTMQLYGYEHFISARLFLKIIDDEIKLRWVMDGESNSSEFGWFICTDASALQTEFDIDEFGKASGLAYFSSKIEKIDSLIDKNCN